MHARARLGLLRIAPGWVASALQGRCCSRSAARGSAEAASPGGFTRGSSPGPGTTVLFYAGIAALAVAWLGLGRELRGRRLRFPGPLGDRARSGACRWRSARRSSAATSTRYLAQGTIAHLGLSPYQHAADGPRAARPRPRPERGRPVLALGDRTVRAAVPRRRQRDRRRSTGSHLIAGVLLIRALELVGLGAASRSSSPASRAPPARTPLARYG